MVVLTERVVKEEQVKYLKVILKEIDWGDEHKLDGGIVYRQIVMNAKL